MGTGDATSAHILVSSVGIDSSIDLNKATKTELPHCASPVIKCCSNTCSLGCAGSKRIVMKERAFRTESRCVSLGSTATSSSADCERFCVGNRAPGHLAT